MEKRLIHSNFSKNITRFLRKDEIYASTDISKHLEEFFKEIFKWVVVQKCLLDQIGKIGVELKSPMAKRYFCIKVMWKHHMTSPNFGEKGHISPIQLLESFPLGAKIQNNKRVNLDEWKSFISWQHFNK